MAVRRAAASGNMPARAGRSFRPMWQILSGADLVVPLADHRRLRFVVGSETAVREVYVEISGSAVASDPKTLPSSIGEAVRTDGRDAVKRYPCRGRPARRDPYHDHRDPAVDRARIRLTRRATRRPRAAEHRSSVD
jgi:hypothetical protein